MAQFNYCAALMDNLSLFGKFLLVLLDASKILSEDAKGSVTAAKENFGFEIFEKGNIKIFCILKIDIQIFIVHT